MAACRCARTPTRRRWNSRPRCGAHATARGWGLEESAARLRIQTIDSFNAYLANAMPLTSGSGFGRGIADAPDDLYALAARETLRHAETDEELRLPFERILRRLDDSWMRLERLIASMLSRRAEWLPNLPQLSGEPLVPRIEQSLRTIVLEELTTRSQPRCPRTSSAWPCEAARVAAANRAEDSGNAEAPICSAWLDFNERAGGALRRPATLARADATCR